MLCMLHRARGELPGAGQCGCLQIGQGVMSLFCCPPCRLPACRPARLPACLPADEYCMTGQINYLTENGY